MSEYQKTMGPVVIQREGETDLIAKCYSGRFDCVFRIGVTCTFFKPNRKLEDLSNTPDWCEMKESALADAREMAGLV